jgi:hypothetical protein
LRSGLLDGSGDLYLVRGRVVVRVGLARYAVVVLVEYVGVRGLFPERRLCFRLGIVVLAVEAGTRVVLCLRRSERLLVHNPGGEAKSEHQHQYGKRRCLASHPDDILRHRVIPRLL